MKKGLLRLCLVPSAQWFLGRIPSTGFARADLVGLASEPLEESDDSSRELDVRTWPYFLVLDRNEGNLLYQVHVGAAPSIWASKRLLRRVSVFESILSFRCLDWRTPRLVASPLAAVQGCLVDVVILARALYSMLWFSSRLIP